MPKRVPPIPAVGLTQAAVEEGRFLASLADCSLACRHPPASHDDDDEAVSLISAMLFPLYQANGWDYRRGDLDDFSVGCDGEEQLRSDPAPAYKPGA
ncbi:hypothetical protein MRX96_014309 [Rhipicephalus microplus]